MANEKSPLARAIAQFDATEANLRKLEVLWKEIQSLIPDGIVFGSNPSYDEKCRQFREILKFLPAIDGWKLVVHLPDLNGLAQSRLDAREIDEISAIVSVEDEVEAPGRDLAEYRFRFNRKRSQLIREQVEEWISVIDEIVLLLPALRREDSDSGRKIESEELRKMEEALKQIDVLLGSSVSRPDRWPDFFRHLRFSQSRDLLDIESLDWPQVKAGLRLTLYAPMDPIPVAVQDLNEIVIGKPRGRIPTKLQWENLSPEQFERLLFALISDEKYYENPEWLTHTNAPDRGRDLSVTRVIGDPLCGTINQRVIIQCKHWVGKAIGVSEIATLKAQMKLWEPPRVDVLIIATTGRFSTDGVQLVEKNNQLDDTALRIEMWPDSHLERLLAKRPDLTAEFHLR